MAIYHLNARGCSPSTGAGAVRKAAYQSGQALVEERSGELCDYARKERVTAEGLALPAAVPAVDRGALWNEAERVWANAGGGKGQAVRVRVAHRARRARAARVRTRFLRPLSNEGLRLGDP